jgi:hypothetical protein
MVVISDGGIEGHCKGLAPETGQGGDQSERKVPAGGAVSGCCGDKRAGVMDGLGAKGRRRWFDDGIDV